MLQLGEGESTWCLCTQGRYDEQATRMVLTKAEATAILSSGLYCGGCQVNRELVVPSQPHKPRERRHNHLADDLEHVTQQGVPLLVRIPTGTELDATRRAAGSLSVTASTT